MKKHTKPPQKFVAKGLKQQPRAQPRTMFPVPEESIEKTMMRLILNPTELKTQLTRIEPKTNPYGVSSVKREGMFINAHGVQEQIQEEVKYIATLKDGTPINKEHGLSRCQACGEVVGIDNIRRCLCGKTCCLSRGCGVYVERHDQWYCCKKHAFMKMLHLNLRFFT